MRSRNELRRLLANDGPNAFDNAVWSLTPRATEDEACVLFPCEIEACWSLVPLRNTEMEVPYVRTPLKFSLKGTLVSLASLSLTGP